MFEVQYIKDGTINKHINVTPDILLTLLKAHKDNNINIIGIENAEHYSLNFESLISNLKL